MSRDPKHPGAKQRATGGKEMRVLFRKLRQLGVPFERGKGGHIRVETPGGPVFLQSTRSQGRAYENSLALLRRNGVDV